MADLKQAMETIFRNEGGLTYDQGGDTLFGISRNAHGDHKFFEVFDSLRKRTSVGKFKATAEHSDLLKDYARQIYRDEYWDPIRGDEIRSQAIAVQVFDMAVNTGPKRKPRHAIRCLQAAINDTLDCCVPVVNNINIAVDGLIGPQTLRQVNDVAYNDPLLRFLKLKRIEYYNGLSKSYRKSSMWLWVHRTVTS